MGHGNLSPRQKMINMMYLVLTALLALNVSAEILNAFVLVDDSLEKTSSNITEKNDEVYTEFNAAFTENPAKVGPWKEKAEDVQAKSKELVEFIESLQNRIVEIGDGTAELYKEKGSQAIKKKDDNNVPAQVMILEKQGLELKEKINQYRELLKSYAVDKSGNEVSGLVSTLESSLSTDDIQGEEEKKPWEIANFSHLPLAGVITMLTKMKTDVKNAEADVINHLFRQVDAGSFKFNKVEAIVKADKGYVLQGEEYRAEVFIAASDTTQTPEIVLDSGTKLKVDSTSGKGIFTTSRGPGTYTLKGEIRLKNPSGEDTLRFDFSQDYQVAAPSVSVSPTKMNVFYIGVDNPVDITAAGVPADKVSASLSGRGSISPRGSGKYNVRVKGGTEVTVRVTADGKSLGSKKFRVKRVPDPVAVIGTNKTNWKGGLWNKSQIVGMRGIRAEMMNFDFDLRFRVTGFDVTARVGGFYETEKSRSGAFTSKQKVLIRKLDRGDRVFLENITAMGPDGTTRNLNDIVIKLR